MGPSSLTQARPITDARGGISPLLDDADGDGLVMVLFITAPQHVYYSAGMLDRLVTRGNLKLLFDEHLLPAIAIYP